MKKILLILVLIASLMMPSKAVLKENGLSNMMEDKRTMVIIDGKE